MRAWLAAGANSVVASRWPARDDEGGLFDAFYSHLKRENGSPAAALAAAQRDMVAAGGWRARPSYWELYFVAGGSQ